MAAEQPIHSATICNYHTVGPENGCDYLERARQVKRCSNNPAQHFGALMVAPQAGEQNSSCLH